MRAKRRAERKSMILRMRFRPEFEVFLTRGSGIGASVASAISGRSADCADSTVEKTCFQLFLRGMAIKNASYTYQKCDVVLLGAARPVTTGPEQKAPAL